MSQTSRHLSNIQVAYQQDLESSERRFRSLIQNGSDLMVIVDNSANYLYVTDPAKRVLGYTAGFFIGKNAIDFIHHEDGPLVLASLKKLAAGAYCELPPYRFRAANGEWRWIESKITNLTEDPAIGGLVFNSRDVTEKKIHDAERHVEAEKRQRQITRAIVHAQERERHAIGNELHDNVNQLLTTVKLYLEMSKENSEVKENLLPKAIEYIQDSIDEIRKLTNRLVSPHHPDLGLNESIQELIDSIALAGALQFYFHPVRMDEIEISEEVQLAIYRITQEQLTNIIRHARATAVEITLAVENGRLELTINDDGQGFDVKHKKMGLGIMNMFNRAESLGGNLDMHSEQGRGCKLTADFPVEKI
jgi:PAS domain S-box-containing protein